MSRDELRSTLDAIGEEIESLGKEVRRRHNPMSVAEWVEWEREFGPQIRRDEPRQQIEFCKALARQFGVSYATVKAAFAGVWG